MIRVHRIPALTDNLIWIVTNEDTKEAIAIDPSQAEPVLKFLKKTDYKLQVILNTHHHHDHIGGNAGLRENWGARIYSPLKNKAEITTATHWVQDKEILQFGWIDFEVIEIPGHTLGHVAFYNQKENLLFCGDTLFSMGCGRLFEGTPKMMWQSLQKLRALPSETEVYCGHEYTLKNVEFALSITPNDAELLKFKAQCVSRLEAESSTLPSLLAVEKSLNPFLRADEDKLKRHMGLQNESADFVFMTLRKMKDQF